MGKKLVTTVLLWISAAPAFAAELRFVNSYGTQGTGPGQFDLTSGVAVSGGLVYASDEINCRIVRFDPLNFLATFTPFGTCGTGVDQFSNPASIAVAGNLVWVADSGNNRIVVFDQTNFATFVSFGTFGVGFDQLNSPHGVALSGGLVWVADTGNNRVVSFDPLNFGTVFTVFGAAGPGPGQFSAPTGVAISGGLVYVADSVNSRIDIFDPASFLPSFLSLGTLGIGQGQFQSPFSVAISGGLVYVADFGNNRIVNFDPTNFLATFSSFGSGGSGPGQFAFPISVAVDGNQVFVADFANSRVVQLQIILPSPIDAAYQVRYAANLQAGESYIDIINTGFNGVPLQGPGINNLGFGNTGGVGNICVNLYALASDEQLDACCSCLVTPDQVVSLGVNSSLLARTLTGASGSSETIKIVGSLPVANSCTNSAGLMTGANVLTAGFVAFGTTLHPSGGQFVTTETPFLPAQFLTTGSAGANDELHSLTSRCASILGNGSGFGICGGCKTGALGALRQ